MAEFELLVKLFDTLKDALKEVSHLCQTMLSNQRDIASIIKSLPIADVKEALKEHAKESTNDIDSCTETVQTQTGSIINKLDEIKMKIRTMIIVVTVAFTLFTAAALVGTIVANSYKTPELKKIEQLIEKKFNELKQESDKNDNEIMELIKEFHKEDKK